MMWNNKVTDNCVTIYNGFGLSIEYMMEHVLNNLREKYPDNKVFKNRSNSSLIKEWYTHNFLFELGICTDRTKDVDMETNPKWYYRLGFNFGYYFFKILYFFR